MCLVPRGRGGGWFSAGSYPYFKLALVLLLVLPYASVLTYLFTTNTC